MRVNNLFKLFILVAILTIIIQVPQRYGQGFENQDKKTLSLTRQQVIDELLTKLEEPIIPPQPSSPVELKQENTLALTLQEAIKFALEKNLDITIKTYEPKIKDALVIDEKAEFDPTLSLDVSKEKSQAITNLSLIPAHKEERIHKIGIEQKLITGADYDLEFESARTQTDYSSVIFSPYHASSLSLTITQPLLKNFGININKANIYIAKNNKDISINQLKQTIMDTISNVQKNYWDLVFTIENLKVKELSLQQAKDLLEMNKLKVKAGELAPIELVQAEASIASREEELILTEDAIKDAEDKLKQVTNLIEDSKSWDLEIVPVDRPFFEITEIDLKDSLKTAFENRPDYIQTKIDVANKDIKIKVAKNQLLPTLDLKGSYNLNGLDDQYLDSLDQLASNDFKDWLIGLSVSFPLGNRDARSKYLQRKLEKEEALISFKKLEQTIIVEVREAVRQINTNLKRVKAAELAQRLQESKLKAEEEKFKVGLSTNFNVLKYQEDLMSARTNYLKAIIDYNKSLVELERVKGTLLAKNNIVFEEKQAK